ncbi:alpha/beta hydrolase [Nocardia sp. CA2R105]|uniref:alpha/beta fold hydrolase n=1 Tax=Nocardia coffeae TaxID=2873381 RepID=UPI001CA602B4|nr:alpha/beta fold hydrolase [Nocardia coffeae]MBY8862340.1 alpha/beta hydrolase [Nocardia coffeae]
MGGFNTVLGGFPTWVHCHGSDGEDVVVALHSLGLDGASFDSVAKRLLTQRRLLVLAPDLRGHGRSRAPAASIDLDALADDVVELARRQHPRRVHLFGTSMGSVVARLAAARDPRLLKSVTLAASPPYAAPAVARRGDGVLVDGMASVINDTLARWFSPHVREIDDPGVRYAARTLIDMDPRAWAASWEAMSRFTTPAALSHVPVACIAGALDESTPPAAVQQTAGLAGPHASMVVIPGAGHQINLEQPEAVADVLCQVIERSEQICHDRDEGADIGSH